MMTQANFYPAGMIGQAKPRAETNPSEIKEQSTSEEVATSAPKKLAPRLNAADERMRRLYDLKPRPNEITPTSKPLVNRKQKARFRSKDQIADSPYMKPEKVPAAATVTTNKKNTVITQHRRQVARRPSNTSGASQPQSAANMFMGRRVSVPAKVDGMVVWVRRHGVWGRPYGLGCLHRGLAWGGKGGGRQRRQHGE